MTLLTGDGSSYVLAISQKDLLLLQCTRYTACEIDLEDVPKAVVHLVEYDERERYKFVGSHPAAALAIGRWGVVFHGQTMGAEHTKKEVLEHFQRVDRAITKMLAGERSPLVLAPWTISTRSTGKPAPILICSNRESRAIPKG